LLLLDFVSFRHQAATTGVGSSGQKGAVQNGALGLNDLQKHFPNGRSVSASVCASAPPRLCVGHSTRPSTANWPHPSKPFQPFQSNSKQFKVKRLWPLCGWASPPHMNIFLRFSTLTVQRANAVKTHNFMLVNSFGLRHNCRRQPCLRRARFSLVWRETSSSRQFCLSVSGN
jgi:hypothetical protein